MKRLGFPCDAPDSVEFPGDGSRSAFGQFKTAFRSMYNRRTPILLGRIRTLSYTTVAACFLGLPSPLSCASLVPRRSVSSLFELPTNPGENSQGVAPAPSRQQCRVGMLHLLEDTSRAPEVPLAAPRATPRLRSLFCHSAHPTLSPLRAHATLFPPVTNPEQLSHCFDLALISPAGIYAEYKPKPPRDGHHLYP